MKINNLHEFYNVMNHTLHVRRYITDLYLAHKPVPAENVDSLVYALHLLESIPVADNRKILSYTDKTVYLDLTYEILELKKDIFFFNHDAKAFNQYLVEFNPGFQKEVDLITDALTGIPFDNFITDRDGTINNYCGRYNSSIQSAYNAIYLTRFAQSFIKSPIILTAAPLMNTGVINVTINPSNTFILAASKGREFLMPDGTIKRYPLEKEQQVTLDLLVSKLAALLNRSDYNIFALIGSGFQKKFGEVTISKQDIFQSIDTLKSNDFHQEIIEIVKSIDPDNSLFSLYDTGKDIEICLIDKKIKKDFTKGHGIDFLSKTLTLNFENKTTLICGDTQSDLSILEHVIKKNGAVYTIFVTTDEALKDQVKQICHNAYFVSSPDILVTVLHELSKKI